VSRALFSPGTDYRREVVCFPIRSGRRCPWPVAEAIRICTRMDCADAYIDATDLPVEVYEALERAASGMRIDDLVGEDRPVGLRDDLLNGWAVEIAGWAARRGET